MELAFCIIGFMLGVGIMVAFICAGRMKDEETEDFDDGIDSYIRVLILWKKGYRIEFKLKDESDNEWHEVSKPSFNFGVATYRVVKNK